MNAETFPISNIERNFIVKALDSEVRIDGRRPLDARRIEFLFSPDDASCTVKLGVTKVLATISAELVPPPSHRDAEGSIYFQVDLSPMAAPTFTRGLPSEAASVLARMLERVFRESNVMDMEALCVLAGRRVWALRCDVTVLDHDGNATDACIAATLGALLAFRRPEVQIIKKTDAMDEEEASGGDEMIVHSMHDREPVALTLHHLPVGVTFGLVPRLPPPASSNDAAIAALVGEDEPHTLIDMNVREEASSRGSLTIVVNAQRDVCVMHKAGGVGLSHGAIKSCVELAQARGLVMLETMRVALEQHKAARVAARVRRRPGEESGAAGVLWGGGEGEGCRGGGYCRCHAGCAACACASRATRQQATPTT